MCNGCDEQTTPPNLKLGVNLLRDDQTVYTLPSLNPLTRAWLEDGFTIELVLMDETQFCIESFQYPIRFGRHFGNKVFFNPMYDRHNINPKFIFDLDKKQWVLINAGYVCFAEQEIEHKTNHKLYGQKDA